MICIFLNIWTIINILIRMNINISNTLSGWNVLASVTESIIVAVCRVALVLVRYINARKVAATGSTHINSTLLILCRR